jgi:diguanylate cyclase (GGDEF)-like protein/PAS domain S-box-containing protein
MTAAVPGQQRLVLDADALPFGVIVFDAAGSARRINSAWTRMTGQTQAKALGDGWLRVIVASDRHNAEVHLRATLAGSATRVTDWRLQPSRMHPQRWIRAVVERAVDDAGATVGAYVFVEDSDEEHNREQRLEYEATHDGLTGVLTRAQFVEQTRHALSRLIRHPSTLGLIFIDLDEFKEVNDLHGHVFGDRVLTAQAQRFPRAVRPNDIVARYGGDEFVVLCEDLGSPDEARAVAERIAVDLSRPHDIDELRIELHASIGVVTTNDPYADLTTLLEHADLAMYRAKQRGRDCVELETLDRDLGTHEEVIDLELERRRDWQTVLVRIHHQLRDAEAALGRLWADEVPRHHDEAAHRLADAARHVSRAVRSLSDDVIA